MMTNNIQESFIARSAAVFLTDGQVRRPKAWWDGVREGAITQELQAIRHRYHTIQDIEGDLSS